MEHIFRRGYKTFTMTEVISKIQSRAELPKKGVVLTFDDGYKNVAELARPVLEEFGFTATIFVTTEYVGRTCGWEKTGPVADLPLMGWREIEEMHRRKYDIQPHSRTHPFLTKLTDEQAWREISVCKEEIEKRFAKKCAVFCYPYGDLDERVIGLVRRAGYQGAVTIEFGKHNAREGLFRLRRLGSAHFAHSMFRFQASLAGIYEQYVKLKDWLPA